MGHKTEWSRVCVQSVTHDALIRAMILGMAKIIIINVIRQAWLIPGGSKYRERHINMSASFQITQIKGCRGELTPGTKG